MYKKCKRDEMIGVKLEVARIIELEKTGHTLSRPHEGNFWQITVFHILWQNFVTKCYSNHCFQSENK